MNPAILVDASEVERLHPEMVDRPTFAELKKIKVGATVAINAGQQDFWANITEIEGEILTAVVPVVIKMHRDNIFSIFKGDSK
jgi:expansin (peptidoglycan-binding protein)